MDISFQQWYEFFGTSPPNIPSPGVDVNRAPEYDVFLSHSGTEKRGIVSIVRQRLVENYHLKVFVDYESLQFGDYAPTVMEQAAWTTPVGLFVLSKDFLQREWPEKELRIFLQRSNMGTNRNVKIVPFFYKVAPRDNNPSLTPEQRALLQEVSKFTGLEKHWEADFDAELVDKLVSELAKLVDNIKKQGGSSHGSTSGDGSFLRLNILSNPFISAGSTSAS